MIKLRLGIGIACLPLAILLAFQSSMVAAVEAQELVEGAAASIGASAGFRLAGCLILGGILLIFGKKTRIAPVFSGILFAIVGIVALVNRGIFADLLLWSILAFILGGALLLSAIKKAEPTKSANGKSSEENDSKTSAILPLESKK